MLETEFNGEVTKHKMIQVCMYVRMLARVLKIIIDCGTMDTHFRML